MDGVQHIIPNLFSPYPTEQTLTKTLLLLWYIWKVRNDQRFQRKIWTSLQVHRATEVHFQTNLTAWGEATTSAPQSNNPNTTTVNLQEKDMYLVHVPSQLQAYGCYSDASLPPDHQGLMPPQAGVDVSPLISPYLLIIRG
jgi:hypothetical protein